MTRTKNSFYNMVASSGATMLVVILNFVTRSVFIATLGKSFLGIEGYFSNVLMMLSLAELGFGTAIVNSIQTTFGSLIISLVVGIFCAYILARRRFRFGFFGFFRRFRRLFGFRDFFRRFFRVLRTGFCRFFRVLCAGFFCRFFYFVLVFAAHVAGIAVFGVFAVFRIVKVEFAFFAGCFGSFGFLAIIGSLLP